MKFDYLILDYASDEAATYFIRSSTTILSLGVGQTGE